MNIVKAYIWEEKVQMEEMTSPLDVHQHIVICWLRQHLATGHAVHQLSPDLGRNTLVRLEAHEVHQCLLLIRCDVGLVALCKDQESLVPQDRHWPWVHLESQKVVDQSVNDLVGKCVLLVQ